MVDWPQYLRFCLFEMFVNMVFVIRCLDSAVSLTQVREQHFIRIIYCYYYPLLCFSGTQKWVTTVKTPPSSWWGPSWTCGRTRRPSRSSRRRSCPLSLTHRLVLPLSTQKALGQQSLEQLRQLEHHDEYYMQKNKEWLMCLPDKLKHSHTEKDRWILNKTFALL